MMMILGCMPLLMMAQGAKYCMTYADYKANNWKTVESLVNGRTEQMPQIKQDGGEYKDINDGAFLLGLGADVASVFTPLGTSIALRGASTALWLGRHQLNSFRCYLVDTDANEKGLVPAE